jgi:hypothetical protein
MPRKPNPITWIYAITGDGERHKIGFAKNIKRRLTNLQTSSAETLRVTAAIPVHHTGARALETKLHEELRIHKIRGEWFQVDEEAIAGLLVYARITWALNPMIVGFEASEADLPDDQVNVSLTA